MTSKIYTNSSNAPPLNQVSNGLYGEFQLKEKLAMADAFKEKFENETQKMYSTMPTQLSFRKHSDVKDPVIEKFR